MQVGDGGVEGKHVCMLKGGTYFAYGHDSFGIEAKALLEAMTALNDLLA